MMEQTDQQTVESSGLAPMPPCGRLLGHLRQLRGDYLPWLDEVRDVHEVIRTRAGPPRFGLELVHGVSPRAVRAILTAPEEVLPKTNPIYIEIDRTLGPGLLTSAGNQWRTQRRTLQPLFTRQHVRTYAESMVTHAHNLADEWQRGPAETDLRADMQEVTLRILGDVLFGHDLTGLIRPLHEAFTVAGRAAVERGLAPIQIPRVVPTPRNLRLRGAEQQMRAVTDDVIDRRADNPTGDDMISLLLQAQDPETGRGLTREEIRDQVLVFLLAGHDTTATGLTFALHLLGHHPDIQRSVHEEIDQVLDGRPPTVDDIGDLATVTRVFEEAMRLHPPAYTIGRHAARDWQLCGYHIPAGTAVLASVANVHRDPTVWEQPNRFDPDRFLPDRAGQRPAYAYIPFGGGPRSCIGSHFAMLEAVLILTVLLQRFEIDTERRDIPVELGITQQVLGDVPAHTRPRPRQLPTRPAGPGETVRETA